MSLTNKLSRLSPLAEHAVGAGQRLYERWESMSPEERERVTNVVRGGFSRVRRPAAADEYATEPGGARR